MKTVIVILMGLYLVGSKYVERATMPETLSSVGTAQPATEPAADPAAEPSADVSLPDEYDVMIEMISDAAGDGDMYFPQYDDFDHDGDSEMFAMVGSFPYGDGPFEGALWFSDGNDVVELTGGEYYLDPEAEDGYVADVKGYRKYYYINDYYTSDSVSHLWSVVDDEPREMFSGGSLWKCTPEGDMTFTFGMYDMGYDAESDLFIGHTYKAYYFYYDPRSDSIREYGGTELTEKELAGEIGEDVVAEIKAEGFEIGSIYKRGNGIVNINYNNGVDYHNANYNLNEKAFEGDSGLTDNWKDSESGFGGTYEAAIMPWLATYPED